MRITNYDELFKLFDRIISLQSDYDVFYCRDITAAFRDVVASYDRFAADLSPDSRHIPCISHSRLLASLSLGTLPPSALSSSPDRKRFHRYELSFMNSFATISSYVREPCSYHVYSISPDKDDVFISRDLFADGVNFVVFYRSKIFIVHYYNEYAENTPFITLLSPSIMFKNETLCLEFLED